MRPHTCFVHFPKHTHNFVVECLESLDSPVSFLHFKVADVLPVQNLVWTITHGIQNKRLMNQVTMGLLFLQLLNHMDKLETSDNFYEQEILMNAFQYIEEHYRDGSLTALSVTDISMAVGYDNFSYFHRIFKKEFGISPRSYRIKDL
mgnify:FL=1